MVPGDSPDTRCHTHLKTGVSGWTLIRELFHAPGTEKDRQRAQEAFDSFSKFLVKSTAVGERRPSLYVNMGYADRSDPNFFLPVRMIWVPLQQINNDGFFVGHKFSVLHPFKYNMGHTSTACLNSWVSLIPRATEDGALDNALEVMPDIWKQKGARYKLYDNLSGFEEGANSDQLKNQPALVFVLSHHDGKGKLYFNETAFKGAPNINSISYTSFPSLAHPSVIVLNACESFDPILINHIRNYTNVDTIVAATSKIKGTVAGYFYRCLSNYMTDSLQNMPVSKLYEVLQDCMSSKTNPDARYELKDLSYIIIGDANLKLCSPWTVSSSGEETTR